MEGKIAAATPELIARVWEQHSGGQPMIAGDREYELSDVEGLAWLDRAGTPLGLVTWAVAGDRGEIVSIHALERGRHIGARLMDAAEEELRRRGVRTALVVTTNDNHRALSFYVRRGYRLVRLHLDGMDRVRALKPHVSEVGDDGIPRRDMWELAREL